MKDNGEHGKLRKLLKNLPRVRATDDFERRLQRRIAAARSEPSSAIGRVFRGYRVPAFAYPLLALAIVGTISYYALLRTDVTPVEELKEAPIQFQETDRLNGASSPAIEQTESPVASEPEKTVDASSDAMRQKRDVPRRAERTITTPTTAPDLEQRQQQSSQPLEVQAPPARQMRRQAIEVETEHAGAAKSGAQPIREVPSAQDETTIEPRKESTPEVTKQLMESPQQKPPVPLVAPRAASAFSSEAAGEIDSTAILDSLRRADSLRQLQIELRKKLKPKPQE